MLLTKAERARVAREEQMMRDNLRTAHLLRCVIQGHYDNPCRYCGMQRPTPDEPVRTHDSTD